MIKKYPKVPHYDHDSVEESFYSADDLVILEKADGSNFRLCMFDSRFTSHYGEELLRLNPVDGDVFIGTKNKIQGEISEDESNFDGNFSRLLSFLRDSFDLKSLRVAHEQYDTPLIIFGEHMIQHTLDYGYESSPPPAVLGFDVFKLNEYVNPPSNPFKQRFEGFLPLNEAFKVIQSVGIEPIHVIDRLESGLNPENISVPMSNYASVQAEGVIIRSDTQNRRTKYLTEHFKEKHKSKWGMNETDAESGEELFVSRYISNARIRKNVHKLVHRNDSRSLTTSRVTEVVVADAWEEELYDIQTIGIELNPAKVYELAYERCDEVIETMQTNAELNDTTLDTLWKYTSEEEPETEISSFNINTSIISSITNKIQNSNTPNRKLVRDIFTENYINSVAEEIESSDSRDMGRWVYKPTYEECKETLWFGKTNLLANLKAPIIPAEINTALLEYVKEQIKQRPDVEINEKSEDWEPEISNADTDGFNYLF